MKKLFPATALLFFFFVHHANAQRFHVGINFGLAVTDIPGTDPRDGDVDFHKFGITAGGFVGTQLNSPKNFLQFEINYTQKGSLQPPDSLNNGFAQLKIDYVDVPILIRHKLSLSVNRGAVGTGDTAAKKFRFEFEYGLSIGRVVHFNDNVSGYTQTFNMSQVNKTDVSLLAGINYHFSEGFYLGFRFSNSVIPAFKKNSTPLFLLPKAFNNGNNIVLQFSFKYIFGLKAQNSGG